MVKTPEQTGEYRHARTNNSTAYLVTEYQHICIILWHLHVNELDHCTRAGKGDIPCAGVVCRIIAAGSTLRGRSRGTCEGTSPYHAWFPYWRQLSTLSLIDDGIKSLDIVPNLRHVAEKPRHPCLARTLRGEVITDRAERAFQVTLTWQAHGVALRRWHQGHVVSTLLITGSVCVCSGGMLWYNVLWWCIVMVHVYSDGGILWCRYCGVVMMGCCGVVMVRCDTITCSCRSPPPRV